LLPLARMLQAGDGQGGGAKKRMQLDRSLLAALADRRRHVPLAVRGDGPHVAGRVVPAWASHCG
jgi:hypothetical protein